MNFLTSLRTLLLAIVLSIGISYAYAAWSPPSNTPPGGNIDAPVNVEEYRRRSKEIYRPINFFPHH
jgi:hypothetical protein